MLMNHTCEHCGDIFHRKGAWRQHKYCCRSCYLLNRWGSASATTACLQCGKAFRRKGKRNAFCSPECASQHRKGRANPKRRRSETKRCDWCDEQVTRPRSDFHSTRTFCDTKCMATWQSEFGPHGLAHPNWNGGRYALKAYSDGWKPARRKALGAAKNRCQKCGRSDARIDVHHIKPVYACVNAKEANQASNLMCLCPTCHTGQERISRKKHPQIAMDFPLNKSL